MKLDPDSFQDGFTTTQLGSFCPYIHISEERGPVVGTTLADIAMQLPEGKRVVDPVAVLELLNFGYICGDRTLIQDINRMPWRAHLNPTCGAITRYPPIPHGNVHMSDEKIAETFMRLLQEELIMAIEKRKDVYLFLSGGLDSRIVAGVLHRMRHCIDANIHCLAWGMENSRDVVYSRQIADWFEWDWTYIPLNADSVWPNIEAIATWGGAEVAGFHLHAFDWCKNLKKEDLVIAASFGDSIGRAEFSQRHLLRLSNPIGEKMKRMDLLHPYLLHDVMREMVDEDIAKSWMPLEKVPEWVKMEHHQQENYMRRLNCHAMDRVRLYCRLHQAFTDERVVSFIWSLCPTIRNDNMYKKLLRYLDPRLFSLPWARTGIAPDGKTLECNKRTTQNHHNYCNWCWKDIRKRLEGHAFGKDLYNLGFLYAPTLNRLYKEWKANAGSAFDVIQVVVSLAGIDLLRKELNVQPCRPGQYLRDCIRNMIWPFMRRR